MIARITSLALALAMLTACEPEPAEPTPTPPNTGSMGQAQDSSAAGDRTRTQTPPPDSAAPAEGGQHYGAEPAGSTMHDESQGMTEEERQAALRACQRLEGPERERCQREVSEQSNPGQPQPGDEQ